MINKYFFIGLIFFYLILLFSANKLFLFLGYLIATYFFFKAFSDLKRSLLYSLILFMISDIGSFGGLFNMEPTNLNLGSGFAISVQTVIILILLPISIKNNIKKIFFPDLILLLFIFWNLISFILHPYTNSLYGVIYLSEIFLVYYLLRTHLKKAFLKDISHIIISMALFQSLLGFSQYILKRPLGLIVEDVIYPHPYGVVAGEGSNLFRITGTFFHPNLLASFLVTLLPFFLLYQTKNLFLKIAKIICIVILFFTYSRVAIGIFILIMSLLFIKKHNNLLKIVFYKKITLLLIFPILMIILILVPNLVIRFNSIQQAFEEGGSMDIRLKLNQEGINLIQQYPIFGVGLNNAVLAYVSNPTTDILNFIKPSKFYNIHNTYLEIASESGLPALILFLLFLLFVVRHYFAKKLKIYYMQAAFWGLVGLFAISTMNPLFHSSQFRLFFLLSAIILV